MELPIFPLNGAVLYPGTSLPLNIFEDRYIEMVNYSLSNSRQIGMIQSDERNKLFNVGCLGKIHNFNETNDGRYLISLQGISCFRVKRELNVNHSFRMVKAELIENYSEDEMTFTENDKSMLLDKYRQYVKIKQINLDLKEIEKIELSQIVKFIAMISPFKDIEKQALLETISFQDFYNKINSIVELEIIGQNTNQTIN